LKDRAISLTTPPEALLKSSSQIETDEEKMRKGIGESDGVGCSEMKC